MRSRDDAECHRLLVETVHRESDAVVSLTFVDPDGGPLSSWEPGAHLELVLPSGLRRHYSLCGDQSDRTKYQVAVLRQDDGRGGSREIHDTGLVGRVLDVVGPRNHFPFIEAAEYVFIAGGIGITPLLPMIVAADERGANWRLFYGGRSRASMAFLNRLATWSHRIEILPENEHGLLDLAGILAGAGPSAAVYACGPEGLLTALAKLADDTGLGDRLHVEHFGAPITDAVEEAAEDDTELEVELAQAGATIQVPAGATILDEVLKVVPDYPYSCLEGFCGTCETKIIEGTPLHRDTTLTDEEKEAGELMMICVSRCKGRRLVLDV